MVLLAGLSTMGIAGKVVMTLSPWLLPPSLSSCPLFPLKKHPIQCFIHARHYGYRYVNRHLFSIYFIFSILLLDFLRFRSAEYYSLIFCNYRSSVHKEGLSGKQHSASTVLRFASFCNRCKKESLTSYLKDGGNSPSSGCHRVIHTLFSWHIATGRCK